MNFKQTLARVFYAKNWQDYECMNYCSALKIAVFLQLQTSLSLFYSRQKHEANPDLSESSLELLGTM